MVVVIGECTCGFITVWAAKQTSVVQHVLCNRKDMASDLRVCLTKRSLVLIVKLVFVGDFQIRGIPANEAPNA